MTPSPEGRPEGMAAPETPMTVDEWEAWIVDHGASGKVIRHALRLYAERRGEEETASLHARLVEVERELDEAHGVMDRMMTDNAELESRASAAEAALLAATQKNARLQSEKLSALRNRDAWREASQSEHARANAAPSANPAAQLIEAANHPAHAVLRARGEEERAKALEDAALYAEAQVGTFSAGGGPVKMVDGALRIVAAGIRSIAAAPSGDAKGTK